MKYLICPKLDKAMNMIDGFNLGDTVLGARVEAWSCKMTTDDKRLAKEVEKRVVHDIPKMSTSPLVGSPLGQPSSAASLKLLVDLIATLNATYPDYDFSDVRPDEFDHDNSAQAAINTINNLVLSRMEQSMPGFQKEFWQIVDEIMELDKCEVYIYNPDPESDVFSVGRVWSLVYFFFNKKANRMLFFHASATNKLHTSPAKKATHSNCAVDEEIEDISMMEDDEDSVEEDDEFSPGLIDVEQLGWDGAPEMKSPRAASPWTVQNQSSSSSSSSSSEGEFASLRSSTINMSASRPLSIARSQAAPRPAGFA